MLPINLIIERQAEQWPATAAKLDHFLHGAGDRLAQGRFFHDQSYDDFHVLIRHRSFTETANTTDPMALHQLTGTMNFKDSDRSDTHTTSASLHWAVLSSGSVIPAWALAHFNTEMSSQILSDNNGSGKLRWSFSDVDDDFDFLSKNQTLTLTYDIRFRTITVAASSRP